MDFVAQWGKNKNAEELVQITHRENHPWYLTAKKYDVLDAFEQNKLNATDYKVDMLLLFSDDEKGKEMYTYNLEFKEYSNRLKSGH